MKPGTYDDHIIDGERFARLVVSKHGQCVAMTAIHSLDFPQTIGGARFVKEGTEKEVGSLAKAMTKKCLAAGIKAGGEKSILIVPKGIPSPEDRADLLIAHADKVRAAHPGAIIGPDMENPEDVLDRVVTKRRNLLRHFTGLSERRNGLSIDKNGYTALGLVEAIRVWQAETGEQVRTVAVQGFGAVGAHVARMLHEIGYRVRAISNARGCAISKSSNGLDIPALFFEWRTGQDEAVEKYAKTSTNSIRWVQDASVLFQQACDVFIPAARTKCFGMDHELKTLAKENKAVEDITELYVNMRPRLIVEGANDPISTLAEEFLEERGTAVLTDYIVNCGGLIGCWVEWQCRQSRTIAGEHAHFKAKQHVRSVIQENVHALLTSHASARATAESIVKRNRERMQFEGAGTNV